MFHFLNIAINFEKQKNNSNFDYTKIILTTYPVGYELPNQLSSERNPPILVVKGFGNEDKMIRLQSKLLTQKYPNKCFPSLFWAAGFSFSSSQMIEQVPYDPHLPFLFFGEEILMASRLWTQGWRFYAPGENVLYHLWKRSYRPTFREIELPERKELESQAISRMKYLLQLEETTQNKEELEKYGMGNLFSLQQYFDFCGVDLKKLKFTEKAKYGGLEPSLFLDHMFELLSKFANGNQQNKNPVSF